MMWLELGIVILGPALLALIPVRAWTAIVAAIWLLLAVAILVRLLSI